MSTSKSVWDAGPLINGTIAECLFEREVEWRTRWGMVSFDVQVLPWADGMPVPDFSQNLNETKRVLDYFRERAYAIEISTGTGGNLWYVNIDGSLLQGDADTLPLAICRAALGWSDGMKGYDLPKNRAAWLVRIGGEKEVSLATP